MAWGRNRKSNQQNYGKDRRIKNGVGRRIMNNQTIAEIILAVIIVVGLIVNCLVGVANIKALRQIKTADLRHETDENDKILKEKPKASRNNERR